MIQLQISCYHAIPSDHMSLVIKPHLPFGAPFAFWHPICLLAPHLPFSAPFTFWRPDCLRVPPFHLMCSFNTYDKRSHGLMSRHHTSFFRKIPLFKMAAKRDHIQRGEICALEGISFAFSSTSILSISTCSDSLQLLFARLRKLASPPPLAAMWS